MNPPPPLPQSLHQRRDENNGSGNGNSNSDDKIMRMADDNRESSIQKEEGGMEQLRKQDDDDADDDKDKNVESNTNDDSQQMMSQSQSMMCCVVLGESSQCSESQHAFQDDHHHNDEHHPDDDDELARTPSFSTKIAGRRRRLSSSGGMMMMGSSNKQRNHCQGTSFSSQTQEEAATQDGLLTQQHDLMTQMATDLSCSPTLPSRNSPAPPPDPRTISWGRLLWPGNNDGYGNGVVGLLPRAPVTMLPSTTTGSSAGATTATTSLFNGCFPVRRGDIFNEYIIGRSSKCDVVAAKVPTKSSTNTESSSRERKLHEWARGMISNKHCKIYCQLEDDPMVTGGTTGMNTTTQVVNMNMVNVYIEDMSGNGTRINNNIVLQRGQKRRLHAGDEICLVQPNTLRKKVSSDTLLMDRVCQQQTFVFMRNNNHSMNVRMSPRPVNTNRAAALSSPLRKRLLQEDALAVTAFAATTASAGNATTKTTNNIAATATASNTNNSLAKNLHRRIEQDYDIRDVLGSGTVGQVRRAIHRQSGQERAVKIIQLQPKGLLPRRLPQQQQQSKNSSDGSEAVIQAEAAILKTLKHPYIVQLYDVYICHNSIFLVMELLQGGDLFDRIVQKGRYTETESRRVLRRLLAALYYLHEGEQVVHRDLKPENILLQSKTDDVSIKLTDFGLAKTIDERQGLQTFCGTPQYFAPEVLSRQHTVAGRGRYGKQADLWSVGVILYILLSGTPPFDGSDIVETGHLPELSSVLDSDNDSGAFTGVSKPATDLVRRLLVQDPSQRLTVLQACRHEWMNIDDGDTHVFALDDPALASATTSFAPSSKATASYARRLLQEEPSCECVSTNSGSSSTTVNCGSLNDTKEPKSNDASCPVTESKDRVKVPSISSKRAADRTGRNGAPNETLEDVSKDTKSAPEQHTPKETGSYDQCNRLARSQPPSLKIDNAKQEVGTASSIATASKMESDKTVDIAKNRNVRGYGPTQSPPKNDEIPKQELVSESPSVDAVASTKPSTATSTPFSFSLGSDCVDLKDAKKTKVLSPVSLNRCDRKKKKQQTSICVSLGRPAYRKRTPPEVAIEERLIPNDELENDKINCDFSDGTESIESFEESGSSEVLASNPSSANDTMPAPVSLLADHDGTEGAPRKPGLSSESRKRRRVTSSSFGEEIPMPDENTQQAGGTLKQQTLAMWFKRKK